jgi:hypothetical protein
VNVQIARFRRWHNLFTIRLVCVEDNPTSGHHYLLFHMNTLYAFLLWAIVVAVFFETATSQVANERSKQSCTTPKSSQTTSLTHYENFSNHPLFPFPDCTDLRETMETLAIRRSRPTRRPTRRPSRSRRPTGYPFIDRVSLTAVPTTPEGIDATGRDKGWNG